MTLIYLFDVAPSLYTKLDMLNEHSVLHVYV